MRSGKNRFELNAGRLLAVAATGLAMITSVLVLAPTAQAASTLTLSTTQAQHGTQLTISYATDAPDPTNWIGIYAVADGEPDGDPGSRVWQYAPGDDGSLTFTIDPAVLPAGDYRAYYLALDGYTPLTAPVDFAVTEAPPGVKAVVLELRSQIGHGSGPRTRSRSRVSSR